MNRAFAATVLALCLTACSSEAPGAQTEAGTAPPAAAPEATPQTPTATDFTPTALTALIEADGPDDTLMALLEQPMDPRWEALLAGVSGADAAWIDAVSPLIPVLDGEAAESLFAALGDALLHQPNQVLIAAGPDGMASVCQPYPPETVEAKIAVLEAIPYEERPTALRRECLQMLYQEPT